MFVISNALRSVIRDKGRNILIIIIAIIATAATIGLAIRQAAQTARDTGLENTTISAQISLDRSALIGQSRDQNTGDAGTKDTAPDFDAMRSALNDKELTLSDYEMYAKASDAVESTYYTETTALNGTDSFQPVSDSSSSSSSGSSDADTGDTDQQNMPEGMPSGGMGGGAGGA